MEKRISFDQFQSVKRVAQACNPLVVKRDKIREKIEKLQAEYNDYDTQVASLEAGIKQVIGFRVEELVKKVIEPGIDANGQPKKTTKYLPTDIVSYDEEKKQFVITTPDNGEIVDPEFEETTPTNNEETQPETEPTEETSPSVETPEETPDSTPDNASIWD